ncbi:uncharacterized protein LOC106662253 isoform X1 [Cimex lectularius]|uniref:RET cysteine rich domain-containing protein n=1 Tax=Cimex lectularius TaxID=79782 RepID=A0A8I6SLB8_CIMLE|nr:uncharacterized protein LOC106662253 isoform X1 [Cimex lectularius]
MGRISFFDYMLLLNFFTFGFHFFGWNSFCTASTVRIKHKNSTRSSLPLTNTTESKFHENTEQKIILGTLNIDSILSSIDYPSVEILNQTDNSTISRYGQTEVCNISIPNLCFKNVDFVVSNISFYDGPFSLGYLGTDLPPDCNASKPTYIIPHEAPNLIWLDGNYELWVNASLGRQEFSLGVVCSFGAYTSIYRDISVKLIFLLEAMPADTVRLIKSASVSAGDQMLVGWACMPTAGRADLIQSDMTSEFRLTMDIKDFTTDLRIILIYLTWLSTKVLVLPLQVTAKLGIMNETVIVRSRLELSSTTLPYVKYPEKSLVVPRSASLYTRLFTPMRPRNLGRNVTFSVAVPRNYETPFEVTAKAGIVYTSYGYQKTPNHTGVLIEWKDSKLRQLGLSWFSIIFVAPSHCPVANTFTIHSWGLCAKHLSFKDCNLACGLAGSMRHGNKGACMWRGPTEPNLSSMSFNYSSCTNDIRFCPDKWCDPFEKQHRLICPQDCTATVILGELGPRKTGVSKGTGVCSCDDLGICHCGNPLLFNEMPSPRREDGKKITSPEYLQKKEDNKKMARQETVIPVNGHQDNNRIKEVNEIAGLPGHCNKDCVLILFMAGGCVSLVLSSVIFVISSRKCWPKKKERLRDERFSTNSLLTRPEIELAPNIELLPTIDIDPKWNVPRSKLILEECLGEGEFGRVLKATAHDIPACPGCHRKKKAYHLALASGSVDSTQQLKVHTGGNN